MRNDQHNQFMVTAVTILQLRYQYKLHEHLCQQFGRQQQLYFQISQMRKQSSCNIGLIVLYKFSIPFWGVYCLCSVLVGSVWLIFVVFCSVMFFNGVCLLPVSYVPSVISVSLLHIVDCPSRSL